MDFCAIDFETATHERNSACELGVCIVQDSKIVETKTWLIKPPSFPYFNPFNVDVHGILPDHVKDAPTFDEIWYEVEEMMYGTLMIAHNAGFDAGVLRGCLNHYGMFTPKLSYLCSIQLAKKSWNYLPRYGLKHLAEYHQLSFNHHRAGDDAEVCAKISLLAFEKLFLSSNEEIADYLKLKIKKL
ncbi:DNA polymerase III subunit epsilon [Chryseobacterium shandongense]|jgi:DNA polymerase-3 subunit epsilon|uniref:DNA polymerase III subunit epsilon n=1 Tax=Chryseobacterium shandongense TaxID=1493872 RepID=A0A3G6Q3U9_9FLAO|nr:MULTISPECIES: 3'-5' exonuclease [Chryseobacterium]AZA57370.1 DNA polymerase III subunit epsilon [Chryseobacterium shandongense]AZA85618.1 DNA polymerase III subunit epsilon [Chryseobacterium shandongense]AZA97791.1 DNA polymerase III subunit epsilon [Chryseobacterium shandongense]